MHKILVLHGVNLDMFGKRDPRHYGHATLADIDAALQGLAGELGVALETFQTNHEGVMVERIHAALTDGTDAIVMAGAVIESLQSLVSRNISPVRQIPRIRQRRRVQRCIPIQQRRRNRKIP